YAGLSYTEIWISEAQERMVLSLPSPKWPELEALCRSEGVEATAIGEFRPTGRLELIYYDQQVADLAMQVLHEGRPPVVRNASYVPPEEKPLAAAISGTPGTIARSDEKVAGLNEGNYNAALLEILGSLNVCSKEWVIRQYDHEVLGGSVIK